jgi:hypothetical protein
MSKKIICRFTVKEASTGIYVEFRASQPIQCRDFRQEVVPISLLIFSLYRLLRVVAWTVKGTQDMLNTRYNATPQNMLYRRAYSKATYLVPIMESVFFPEGGGGSSTQAWMPTYVSILHIPQMIWVWRVTAEWLTGENWRTRRKTCPNATLSKSHMDWPGREHRPPRWEAGG